MGGINEEGTSDEIDDDRKNVGSGKSRLLYYTHIPLLFFHFFFFFCRVSSPPPTFRGSFHLLLLSVSASLFSFPCVCVFAVFTTGLTETTRFYPTHPPTKKTNKTWMIMDEPPSCIDTLLQVIPSKKKSLVFL